MVFVEFDRRILNNAKEELKKLEQKLKKLGWTDLTWGPYWDSPSGPSKTDDGLFWCRSVLRGCPPGYEGPYEDYKENALITLVSPNNPSDTIAVAIRKHLDRPYFVNNRKTSLTFN